MYITIAELARSVDKSETYIRQHIHRGHLAVRRDGRNVSVSLDEAMRWAHERGLSFNLPARAPVTTGAMESRTARMMVLAWHSPSAQLRNLFTLIRHRRQDALGPWAGEPDETWSSIDLGHELRLFSLDASWECCQTLVGQILASGTLGIDDLEIQYALEPIPRRHWAYRDDRPLADASMRSPFSRHSAEIIEYWSFTVEPRKRWLEILESLQSKALPQIACIGFPLDRCPDRVGNLMIAAAQDAIVCDLSANRNRTLRLHVDANELLSGAYRATVWASHSGDRVLRREVPVTLGQRMIELASDVDHIGFEILRTADGQCVDLMEAFLLMEVGVRMEIKSGPTLHLSERKSSFTHEVNPSGFVSTINVQADQDSAELDRGIRRRWLDRQVYERENIARREGNLVRFRPAEFERAIQHFTYLLRQDADQTAPIYLADPYFMDIPKPERDNLKKLYLNIFEATNGRPLRILCAKEAKVTWWSTWWSNLPNQLTSHINIRVFLEQNSGGSGFHDRYLIMPKREIVITHSFNGWHKEGVTFSSHPYGVYRAEAESLWSMGIGSKNTDCFVKEIA